MQNCSKYTFKDLFKGILIYPSLNLIGTNPNRVRRTCLFKDKDTFSDETGRSVNLFTLHPLNILREDREVLGYNGNNPVFILHPLYILILTWRSGGTCVHSTPLQSGASDDTPGRNQLSCLQSEVRHILRGNHGGP